MGRCFYCQIDFEAELKTKGTWTEWASEQEINRWDTILKEVEHLEQLNSENKPFDESVANALANGEVELTIMKTT